MSDPLAYFLTWHTYGSWLHGQAPGSVDAKHGEYGSPFAPADAEREAVNRAKLIHAAVTLEQTRRTAVQEAIVEVCSYRKWTLLALHIRTTHVHAVVSAGVTPEKMLNDFKAYATRRLRRENLAAADLRVWSVHGSTRYLWKDVELAETVDYVVNRQGSALVPSPVYNFKAASEPGASATG